MTVVDVARRDGHDLVAAVTVALGCVALLARPVSYGSTIATVLVGCAGLAFVQRTEEPQPKIRWIAVAAAGVAAFLVVRLMGPGIGVRLTHAGIAVTIVAGVAEEAFFRRFVYGWICERAGVAAAIVVSAALFALVHIPAYGIGVLAVDFAAGVLLGWQRWASGGWTAPALTHSLGNLMMLG